MTTLKQYIGSILSYFSFRRSSAGSVMVPALITMVILGYTTLSLVQVRAGGLSERSSHLFKSQSEYIAYGGIELAKYKITNGKSADTGGDVPFAAGVLQTVVDPSTKVVTVTGKVNEAKTTLNVRTQFAADCVFLPDTYDISMGPTMGNISDFKIKKTCLNNIVIKKITVTWTDSLSTQRVTKLVLDGSVYYDGLISPPTGAPPGGALSGIMIDNNDISISDTATHTFNYLNIVYPSGNNPKRPTVFTITYYFLDGSSVSKNYDYL